MEGSAGCWSVNRVPSVGLWSLDVFHGPCSEGEGGGLQGREGGFPLGRVCLEILIWDRRACACPGMVTDRHTCSVLSCFVLFPWRLNLILDSGWGVCVGGGISQSV